MNLKQVVMDALGRAKSVHDSLGKEGIVPVGKNRFGDTSLKGDIEAEKVVFDCFQNAQIPIRFVSEEHGVTDITPSPKYLGVLDGTDGSGVYKKYFGTGRYGTLLGIFSSLDPYYNDYVVCGFMEHATGRLFIASKNGGSFVVTDGSATRIQCSNSTVLDDTTRIHIDGTLWWGLDEKTVKPRLDGLKISDLHCSAAHHTDLAMGVVDVVAECTRKNNLEIAIDFGLVREAGGCVVDRDCVGIGQRKYVSWEQDRHVPIVMAATQEIAQQFCRKLY